MRTDLRRSARRDVVRAGCGLVLALLVASCSPAPSFHDPRTAEPATLGELVYRIVRDRLETSETCPAEYVDALATNHERFVTTFDYVLSHELTTGLPEVLGGTIQPFVESGDLPALSDALAEALALLISDQLDPDRQLLGAVEDIAHTKTVLSTEMAIDLVSSVLADPSFEATFHALAALAQEHDGVDYMLDSVLEMTSRNLSEPETTSACTGFAIRDVDTTLLRTDGFVEASPMGQPAWVARMDPNGNPWVARDPVRGLISWPFVDANLDGVADVNAAGEPIDAQGNVISIAPIGTDGDRDEYGRALNANGGLMYVYYDAKRVALAWAMQLGREALELDVHRDAMGVVRAALGDTVPCNDGTTTCYQYPSGDHILADLVFMLFELGEYDRVLALLDSLAVVVNDNPELTDRLFVQLGHVIQALEATDLSITDPQLLRMLEDLMPLVEKMFETSNGTAQSTPRLLMQTLHDLGAAGDAFPAQLGYLVDYRSLSKTPACGASPPDLAASTPTDYALPRYVGATDNRSALEQVVELLEVADCGSVPLTGGRTVAYVFLDILASQSPSTVCTIIDVLLGALNSDWGLFNSIAEWIVVQFLNGIGCDGQQVYDALGSLDALAKSGALDAMLPIAKVFKDQGQITLLIDLLAYMAADLRLDEDALPATRSVVRRLEPTISEMVHSGALATMFDLLDVLVTVPAEGGGTLADVMIDSAAQAVNSGTVQTRTGYVQSSKARVLLASLETLVTRLVANGGADDLGRLIDYGTSHLTRTRVVGGVEQLRNPNLRPLLGMLLDVARSAADLPHAQYLCYLHELQTETNELLLGRDFATVVRLETAFEASPNAAVLEDFAAGALTPRPDAPEAEVFGPLMQIAAALLTSEFEDADLGALFRWLAEVSRQRQTDARALIGIADDLLTSDTNHTLLTMGRTMLSPGPLPTGERPISTFADIFDQVTTVDPTQACMPTRTTITAAGSEDVLQGVVPFMQDDVGGFGAIYDLVGRISTPTP